jgi:hypothetical protein
MLTASIVVALLFVALALLVNAAVFTENLGARTGGDVDGHEALQYRDDVRSLATRTFERANDRTDATYDERWRTLGGTVENWSALAGRHAAVTGDVLNVSLFRTINGTNVSQTTVRNLTTDGGARNWTLVRDATDVRAFSLTLDPDTLAEPDATESVENLTDAGAFNVTVTNATRSWRVHVYRNGTDLAVRVASPAGTLGTPCRVPLNGATTVTVDLLNGTAHGASCAPLDFLAGVTGQRTVAYGFGAGAQGTYDLVTDRDYSAVSGGEYATDPAEGPTVSRLVLDATVRVTYATPTLSYRSDVTVTWGGQRD